MTFGICLLYLTYLSHSYANNITQDTRPINAHGLPLPRFVSLKSHKVNVRHGPGKQYPILWQFQKRGLPIEIIAEYGHWRHIRDHENQTGWIHTSLLSGRRQIIIQSPLKITPIRKNPQNDAIIVAFIETQVVAKLKNCNVSWCKIIVENHKGWIPRDIIWGIYPFEYIE